MPKACGCRFDFLNAPPGRVYVRPCSGWCPQLDRLQTVLRRLGLPGRVVIEL